MKKTTRKMTGILLTLTLIISAVFSPSQSTYVEAAKKAHMKKLNLQWDLKKNKTVTCTTAYAGGKFNFSTLESEVSVKKPIDIKITDFKTKKASKKGYKKITFTVSVKSNWTLNEEEVHQMVNSEYCQNYGKVGGGFYYTVVDYNTGRCLEDTATKSKFNVTVKDSDWEYSEEIKYEDTDGCEVTIDHYVKTKVTITYPKNYKGLCIGVGGINQVVVNEDSVIMFSCVGTLPYGKTSYYKKGKNNSHWMRVTK